MSCNVVTPQCEDQIRQKLDRHLFVDDADFYYCHVQVEQLAIPIPGPEAYASAGQMGYNLVGLSVAMALAEMHPPPLFVPSQFYNFVTLPKYKKMLRNLFTSLTGLYGDAVVACIQFASTVGDGGIGMYVMMTEMLNTYHSSLSLWSLQILKSIGEVKEITYVEIQVNPCAGLFIYSCLAVSGYSPKVSMRSLDENDTGQMTPNYNIFNPWRFEEFLFGLCVVEDFTATTDYIRKKHRIGINNFKEDKLKINWIKDTTDDQQHVVGVSFSNNIIKTKEVNNLIVRYCNKSKTDMETDNKKTLILIGDKKIGSFFNAMSQFIYQPIVTRYLYNCYLKENEKDIPKYLQPGPIQGLAAVELDWMNFKKWLTTFKFGFMGSGTTSFLAKRKFNRYMKATMSGNIQAISNPINY